MVWCSCALGWGHRGRPNPTTLLCYVQEAARQSSILLELCVPVSACGDKAKKKKTSQASVWTAVRFKKTYHYRHRGGHHHHQGNRRSSTNPRDSVKQITVIIARGTGRMKRLFDTAAVHTAIFGMMGAGSFLSYNACQSKFANQGWFLMFTEPPFTTPRRLVGLWWSSFWMRLMASLLKCDGNVILPCMILA